MQTADPATPTGSPPRWWVVLAPAAALVLAALCLRAPFSAVGPVLGELGDELSLPQAVLSVLPTLPLVCFGLVSPVAPALAARLGVHRAVLAGLVVLAAGIALRTAGTWGLYVGTVLLSAGIAVGNVLVPAAARAVYGNRAAPVLGATTATMGFSASLGAGLAQPLVTATGSAVTGLTLWLAPVLVAIPAMALLARRARPAPGPPTARLPVVAVLRDRVALAVTVFFGLQSLAFYVMLTWMADVLEDDAGTSAVTAGGLVAAAAAFGAPCALVVPPLAARQRSQVAWVAGATLLSTVGILGLLVAPTAAPAVWAVLWGLGTGTAFPLALTLVLVRTRDAAQTGRLSAAAQSVGYLLAAAGPLAVGLLHDATGGWRAGLAVLLVLQALQLAAGLYAGRPRLVTETAADAEHAAEARH
ncbi:MFS transporter [Geodermatophilus obscurus]|uniref:Major facilitator superfamily MFS_1 n=1 Tax=Geodermatophilus obscurus (strain ATCC 25078 / DSM 43160 / JCM 3152 / CCUG 61914 / KCC A-0152 / KCTC 9177 / NBRC 13315 / NRRL B-3577 / G-20) TaxID=526225 RepID=D2SFX3_GEOOG|nr:MFS transporter [Geodermatophilus obscurus]ADB74878.1 major facilitator superfamily MFS_1 [Geodermatophilus obscurus DSM 43160]